MGKYLTGNILRETKNARLNGSSPESETYKDSNKNTSYVKKIRREGQIFPYVSGQNQKRNICIFAEMQGHRISPVIALSKEADKKQRAKIDGHPYRNYNEDVMGFMVADSITIEKEEYDKLDEKEKKLWEKKGKKYKKNITKKRRSNLMISPLQAIGHTRITNEFCTRETDKHPMLYAKEVYSTNMSSSFILDIERVGRFVSDDSPTGYRDYSKEEVKVFKLEEKDGVIELDKETKLKRIEDTIRGLQLMPMRGTMANNLEDMSAKFMIFAEYKLGISPFNNIFEDNKLKIDYLKEAIEQNERYRLSKIYIGCRSEFFKQDNEWLRDILEYEFRDNEKFVVGSVDEVVTEYLNELSI